MEIKFWKFEIKIKIELLIYLMAIYLIIIIGKGIYVYNVKAAQLKIECLNNNPAIECSALEF